MFTTGNTGGGARVDAAVAIAAERLDAAQLEAVGDFIRIYYAGTPREDLEDRDPADLYGAALAQWKFARQRDPGTPKVRAYNPRLDDHGWQSSHTVVEIVNEDMPFLVDSVQMLLNERGLTTHLVIHPQFSSRRDARGELLGISASGADADAIGESLIHVEVDSQPDQQLDALSEGIRAVLADVRAAVEDWQPMRDRLAEVIAELESRPPPVEAGEIDEAVEFLKWLKDHHFTFLGFREYELVEGDDGDVLSAVEGSALGLFRGSPGGVSRSFARMPSEIRALAREPRILVITKANTRSTVHRAGHLDYVGVKRFDDAGVPTGECRFLGLYTSAAYNRTPESIPVLRHKVARVMDRTGFRPNGHDAKNLLNILESFPRDLLLQITDDALLDMSVSILHLQERQRVRLLVYPERYRRFVTCIVYVPRDRFNTGIRLTIQSHLAATLNGTVADFAVSVSESILARLYFVYRIGEAGLPEFDIEAVQMQIDEMTRTWSDRLHDALVDHLGEEQGVRLFQRYGRAFHGEYRERYPTRVAVHDITTMEALGDAPGDIEMSLYQPLEANDNMLRFKLFHPGRPVPLFETLPMLENMGLQVEDEQPSTIDRAQASQVWLHDFGMDHREGRDFDIEPVKEHFLETFERIWRGEVENDRFNGLVLRAGLDWREIVMLRACAKYLRQARSNFSQDYMERTLLDHPAIARSLVGLFHRRFDPALQDTQPDCDAINAAIDAALDEVPSLDEDRILRSYRGLIMAMLRTNFYQPGADGAPKPHLSFKFAPALIADLPEPRPMFEIFVYSPRVEGVHLRGGPVARGGLRWSDRREDFRTEVLGLVKAQMVKNAVIVPVGSKGGFYPKRLPTGDREAIQAEGVACYETFIRGLLDLTDNLLGGEVRPPRNVVRHDGDDTYLVVAADKGTATFSDVANRIAHEYGFWLGDAFASGGSNGYDHKAMGITARGAWESVKRHFRELGVDTQTTGFTVIGIGDMAGDVFGNGMLLSEHIRLVAAFNHLHVFLDPDPDAALAFAERQRLFALPRSSWDDYDRSRISAGGGVWPRSAKSIPLTPEVRKLLQTDRQTLTPNELIRALLQSPVDLLWNGGIGTFVKSSAEDHGDVGDRANDAIRVDARDLRCAVIGEGGNLGITQLARIEFAKTGGRVNTDAIDNSGGVDCSDHEVNIKILLNEIVAAGDMTEKQRNALLDDMTDEVTELVLRNNYLQTQALSVAAAEAAANFELQARLVAMMEADGELVREHEYLPGNEEVAERLANGSSYTSPELCVLLSYAKIEIYPDLLASSVPDDPFLTNELARYFPRPIRENFGAAIPRHRLAREIVGTSLANEIVNRCGITFAFMVKELTGADMDGVARAYLVVREVFGLPGFWADVEALDNRAPAAAQTAALIEGQRLTQRAVRWLLRNRPQPLDIAGNVARFAPGAELLAGSLKDHVTAPLRERFDEVAARFHALGLPEAMAGRIATFDDLFSLLDIVEVSEAAGMPIERVASIYFALAATFELGWLRDRIASLPTDNRWRLLARAALREELYVEARAMTGEVLRRCGSADEPQACIAEWMDAHRGATARWNQILGELKAANRADFTMLSVGIREFRGLRQRATDASG